MKTLLTGATGYIGSAVAKALQENDIGVIGLARSDDALKKLSERGIPGILGELANPEAWSSALDDVDGVIHLASPNDETAAELDQTLIEHVIDKFAGTGKTLVYTSGTLIYGSVGDKIIDENTAPNPIPLVAWRPAIEDQVIKASEKGLNTKVIRPAWVYGNGGGILAIMQSLIQHLKGVPVIGDGQNIWSTVHVEDLADAYVRAFTSTDSAEIIDVANGAPVTQIEIAGALASVSGIPDAISHVPLEDAAAFLGPFAEALTLSQHVSANKAHEMLKWEPKSPSILNSMTDYSMAVSEQGAAN